MCKMRNWVIKNNSNPKPNHNYARVLCVGPNRLLNRKEKQEKGGKKNTRGRKQSGRPCHIGLMEICFPINVAVHAWARYSQCHHYNPIKTQDSISSICSSKTVVISSLELGQIESKLSAGVIAILKLLAACAPWAGSSRSLCITIMAALMLDCFES